MKTFTRIAITFSVFVSSIISSFAQTELWGVTEGGGSSGLGVIFKTDQDGTNIQVVHSFLGGTDGGIPAGNLVQATNGKLYGVTNSGGINNYGILFEYDVALNNYNKIYDFDSTNSGNPYSSLIRSNTGKLYGMTSTGGALNVGGIFEFDPELNLFSKLYDFDTVFVDGLSVTGNLCQASNGKLYGMTTYGGVNNNGVVFEFDLGSNTYTKKADFNSTLTGRYPLGSLFAASNGKLYGMTNEGGLNVEGTLFEFDPSNNAITKLFDFGSTNGSNPYINNLMQASNGKLYGTTPLGGTNLSGVLFEYDLPSGPFTKKIDFNEDTTAWPVASLVEAANGNLFGMTQGGLITTHGVIYEYNIGGNSVSVSDEFNGTNGEAPYSNSLVAVDTIPFYSVWPGDCNNDLTVDNFDFLYLGLAWNDSGATRPGASLNWVAQPASSWTNSFSSGINHKHADTNGDGAINENDSAAIYLNYNQVHLLRPASIIQNTNPDIYLIPNHTSVAPGDTVIFEIHLANSSAPIDSLYGIAFSLSFDEPLVDTTSLSLDYSPSVLGTINSNMKSFEKDFYSSGKIDAAVTRINQTNAVNFYGVLGTFSVVASQNISSVSTLHVTPLNIRRITAGESDVLFNTISDSILIDPALGIKDISNQHRISVFPNPSKDYLSVLSQNEIIRSIDLFDMSGRKVFTAASMNNQINISVQQFDAGIYSLSIITDRKVVHKKIEITR